MPRTQNLEKNIFDAPPKSAYTGTIVCMPLCREALIASLRASTAHCWPSGKSGWAPLPDSMVVPAGKLIGNPRIVPY